MCSLEQSRRRRFWLRSRMIFRNIYRFFRCLWCCLCCCYCRCCCCSRRCPCCGCFCDCNKIVYLLDPEGGDMTKDFVRQFKVFVSWSFCFKPVKSLVECTDGYPIAIVLRRQTARAAEDIKAMMTKIDQIDQYDGIALISFHSIMDKKELPQIPTTDNVKNVQNLGIILDFGYARRNNTGVIHSCNFRENENSKEAFENFVTNENAGRIRTCP